MKKSVFNAETKMNIEELSWRDVALCLYERTLSKLVFSVNDFRRLLLHKQLRHNNEIGRFFGYLQERGLIKKDGIDIARHKEAHGRWVWSWRWTKKAKELFN